MKKNKIILSNLYRLITKVYSDSNGIYVSPRIIDKEKSSIVNLIKNLKVDHLNQVWNTDVTYIHTINEGLFI